MAEETLEGACPLKTLLKCPDFYLEYSLDHQNEGCTFCAEHPSIWAQWLPHARACIWKGKGNPGTRRFTSAPAHAGLA